MRHRGRRHPAQHGGPRVELPDEVARGPLVPVEPGGGLGVGAQPARGGGDGEAVPAAVGHLDAQPPSAAL